MIPYIYDIEDNEVEDDNVICLLTIRRFSEDREATSSSGIDVLVNQQAFYDTLGILMDGLPIVSPYVINVALLIFQQADGKNDAAHKILLLGSPKNAGYACEFGYPIIKPTSDIHSIYTPSTITNLNDHIILNAFQMRLRDLWQTFPYSLRFVKNSIAHLSMMNNQVTIMCEIALCIKTGVQDGEYVVMKAVQEAVSQTPDVRFHWGLYFGSVVGHFDDYPDTIDDWRMAYLGFNSKRTFSCVYHPNT